MSLEPDAQTLKNIRAARTYDGIPPDQHLTPYASIGDLLDKQTEAHPGKLWLIHYDAHDNRETYTYQQFSDRVNQAANALRELGIRRGDRIATMGYNHAALVILYFACWKLGATVAPQNIAEDDERIGYILRNSEAVVLFARADLLDRARQVVEEQDVTGIREIVEICDDPCATGRHFDALLDEQPTTFSPSDAPTLDDEALLVYTSGTTGPPKGVVLMQYNLLADAMGIGQWHAITPDQRMMCVLPIHHVNGIVVTLVTPLYAGASTVLNRGYSSSQFWARIARENVQIVSVVPTLLQYSLEYAQTANEEGRSMWGEGISREDLTGFRHFICGAGTLSVALAAAFEEMFGFPIMHGYGLSETTCYSCFLPISQRENEHRRWMQDYGYPSIGAAISPNEMAIFDAEGRGEQLGAGMRGEICIRGHNVMKYYFNRPDANAETFKFGWFRSGDEGFYELDGEGRKLFFITGRIKELINRGGVKFSPFDIEEVLLELPGVQTGLAVAFENDYYGEEVGAYIVLQEDGTLTEAEVIGHCRERMTFEKSPKAVVFGKEIPVTSTGKYQRLKLRDRFTDWKHTQFKP